MESFIVVEVADKDCRCCLRHFDSNSASGIQVTEQTRKIFHEFFDDELDDGFICVNCHENLQTFSKFRHEVMINRELFKQSIRWRIDEDQETDEQHLNGLLNNCPNDDPLGHFLPTIYNDEPECESHTSYSSKKQNLRRILRLKLNRQSQSEHKKTFESYKPKYFQNDDKPLTKSRKVFCPICCKPVTYRALLPHLRTHDTKRERNFMCEMCSKTFLNNHELVIHRRTHLNIRPFQCDFDDKTFTTKANLLKHIHSQHLNKKQIIEFKVTCPVCQKLFPFPSKMNEHYKKAHPGGQDDGVKVNPATNHFHCQKCSQEFLTKYRFDNHICLYEARGGSTENRCPVCLLLFLSRLELTKHLQEHGEKLKEKNKWRCKVCDAVVKDKIAVHVENTHSNESVQCSLCNKQLKNRKSLRQHLLLSHQNGYEVRKKKRQPKTLLSKNFVV